MIRRYEFQFQEEIQLIAWILATQPEGHSGATSRRHAITFPLKACPLANKTYIIMKDEDRKGPLMFVGY